MSKIENAISDLKRYNSNYIKSNILKEVNNKIWDYKEFSLWPGSIGKHHSYEGGLIVHTHEVWKYALNTAMEFEVDLDILFTSILWHDLAKIWDYKKTVKKVAGNILPKDFVSFGEEKCIGSLYGDNVKHMVGYEKSNYHSHIHHITGSIAEFSRHALNLGLDRDTLEKVQHCIAGHHGFPEWRSPVTPKSIEAIIMHFSDMLSATHGRTKDEL